uniref:Uncharacterized protein n=1 Tax=Timema bartmani TaxID=61472 RepID=A0A7R9EQA7_9NEOP|nr:unnamed protein product [Timema bartmani]
MRRDGPALYLFPKRDVMDIRCVRVMDSGHETLFSDDSPCDLGNTPSACSSSGLGSASSGHTGNHDPTPPNITPYSGVLGKLVAMAASILGMQRPEIGAASFKDIPACSAQQIEKLYVEMCQTKKQCQYADSQN